jgi:hypothetical protein
VLPPRRCDRRACTAQPQPQLLGEHSTEDRYGDPGTPLLVDGAGGRLATVATPSGGRAILLRGLGASEFGDRPFLDALELGGGGSADTGGWRRAVHGSDARHRHHLHRMRGGGEECQRTVQRVPRR